MLDFVLVVKQTNIVELLNISLKEVIAKILNVLEYFSPQLLNGLLYMIIFLSNVRLQEKPFHRGFQAAYQKVISNFVLQFATYSTQLLLKFDINGLKVMH